MLSYSYIKYRKCSKKKKKWIHHNLIRNPWDTGTYSLASVPSAGLALPAVEEQQQHGGCRKEPRPTAEMWAMSALFPRAHTMGFVRFLLLLLLF